jgi:hypothetical protein
LTDFKIGDRVVVIWHGEHGGQRGSVIGIGGVNGFMLNVRLDHSRTRDRATLFWPTGLRRLSVVEALGDLA